MFEDGAEWRGMREIKVTLDSGTERQRISVRNSIALPGVGKYR
jgi:hypothetical protein